MTLTLRILAATLTAALVAPLVTTAQDLHPSRRPSPMGLARITLGDTYVRVVYGRPYKRGRSTIFGTKESGAVVPYGERWRTGANEATEITVTGGLLIAGKRLAVGTYSLFTTPGPDTWTLHFNSKLGLDGVGIFANNTFTPVDRHQGGLHAPGAGPVDAQRTPRLSDCSGHSPACPASLIA